MKVIITLIICSLIGYHLWNKNEKAQNNRYENRQNIINALNASARASSNSTINSIYEHASIDRTLRLVAENWKIKDVNRDGLHNCIDAAVLFYQYYPDKKRVCIEENINSKTGMNHLFNCVFTDGVWKAIEPQSYASNHSNYLMKIVWGSRYDNSYNRDVTSHFLRYVRK